jgi:hypothetical protein
VPRAQEAHTAKALELTAAQEQVKQLQGQLNAGMAAHSQGRAALKRSMRALELAVVSWRAAAHTGGNLVEHDGNAASAEGPADSETAAVTPRPGISDLDMAESARTALEAAANTLRSLQLSIKKSHRELAQAHTQQVVHSCQTK